MLARAVHPEVLAVADQIGLRLGEQRGIGRMPGVDLAGVARRQRKLVAPELDGAVREWPFARGLIALLGKTVT